MEVWSHIRRIRQVWQQFVPQFMYFLPWQQHSVQAHIVLMAFLCMSFAVDQASAVMYSMRSRDYDVAGAASTSPPSMPSPTEHTEHSGTNSPCIFTSKHVSVKAGKGNVHFKNRGRRSIFVVHKMTM